MGLFQRHAAPDAYDAVYGGRRPHHEVTHELLAGAVGFEVMRMYEHHLRREGLAPHHALAKELLAGFVAAEIDRHFGRGHYGHLNRHQARRLAQEQADYLWRRQYGRLFGPEGEGGEGLSHHTRGANGAGDGDDQARKREQHQLTPQQDPRGDRDNPRDEAGDRYRAGDHGEGLPRLDGIEATRRIQRERQGGGDLGVAQALRGPARPRNRQR